MLQDILPTAAERILNHIQKIRVHDTPQLEKTIPGKDGGEIIIDVPHVPIERLEDNKTRELYYSGKKKRFSLNTTIITNKHRPSDWNRCST